MKTLSYFFITLAVPLLSFAQTTVVNLNISEIQFDKTLYQAGEEIKGYFILSNDDASDYADLGLTYALIRVNPDTGVIEDTYGLVSSAEALFMPATSKKTVPITLSIPFSGRSDNLRFVISLTRPDGNTVVFHHTPVQVSGFLPTVTIGDSFLVLGEKEYSLQEGPMVKEIAPLLNITLLNDSMEILTLTPVLKVKILSTENPVLAEKTYDAVVIAVKGENNFSLPLPLMEKSGVYLAELSLNDNQGRPRASSVFVRYIMAGDIATISSITTDKKELVKGETVSVSVGYTGGPVDIETGRMASLGNATLHLKLLNENSQIIAEESSEVNLDTLGAVKEFTSSVSNAAQALTAEATIVKDGIELARYSVNLSGVEPSKEIPSSSSNAIWLWWVIGVGILFLIGIAGLFLSRKNRPSMFVMMIILVGTAFFHIPSNVFAQTYSNSASSEFSFTASTYVNKTTYTPGESVSAQIQGVSLVAAVCTNFPRTATNTYILSGNTNVTQTWSDNSGANNHGKTNWSTGMIGYPSNSVLNAPSAPGTYNLTVNVTLYTNLAFPGGPYLAGLIIPFTEYPRAECVADGGLVRSRNSGPLGCQCGINSNGCTGRVKTITIPIVVPITVACASGTSWNGSTCVVPDVCSNISGTQASVPSGTYASGGQCLCLNGGTNPSTCTPSVVDVCSNISGSQASVPLGTYASGGQCLCSNGGNNPLTCTPPTPIEISVRLQPNIVNRGETCNLNWTLDESNNDWICSVNTDDGNNYTDSDANSSNGFQVISGLRYKVSCHDPVNINNISTSNLLNCLVNPKVIER